MYSSVSSRHWPPTTAAFCILPYLHMVPALRTVVTPSPPQPSHHAANSNFRNVLPIVGIKQCLLIFSVSIILGLKTNLIHNTLSLLPRDWSQYTSTITS